MEERPIIIANWKMRLDHDESVALTKELLDASDEISEHAEVVLCPSYDSLSAVAELIKGSDIRLGAQDVFWQERGAYTGEISASMLRIHGVDTVIVGHSERRTYLKEDDEMVNRKIRMAFDSGLVPILCVGETYAERSEGKADLIIMRQVIEGLRGIPLDGGEQLIIAYEPVWVIGTGQAIDVPEAEHSAQVIHQAMIDLYPAEVVDEQTRIIYGGSVDANNIAGFIGSPLMKGALVGTASMKADSFIKLLSAV